MVSQDSSVDPPSVHPFTISDLDVLPSIQLLGERISRSIDLVQDPTLTEDSETCDRRHLMMNLLGVAKDTDHHQSRRLSLTLGSHLQSTTRVPSLHSRIGSVRSWLPNVSREEVKETCLPGGECMIENYSFVDNFSALTSTSASRYRSCSTSYELESFATIVGCSRYLKPAQSLLEEVVNVGAKDVDFSSDQPFRLLTRNGRRGGALGISTELQGERYCNGGSSSTTAEEHELQIRIVKLIALLDEVDGRYEHYYHQLEEVVSSFEVITGQGAARSYTCLALQAMSRHFSSLRDAIIVQINVAKRELDQNVAEIHSSLSRVVAIQNQNQNQNQNQAWRSMRGLPENSVAILRSWLFEHFLHPYPKDSEKLSLASQTGLTKNQVSNWFINARVRLWKPMIEEMYTQEFTESSSTGDQLCDTEAC
ncbi:BEL1-like homeodomain protein 11 [Telopea speciosissima]|uniref:BEL1-like homeodomain protein 11 n=1 Tax=Telopea speciosissima TaxID=54955 RepID=UPI001CC757DD|nr:BEL1-like homeodomain protein 11 [Telopea speciosissima]